MDDASALFTTNAPAADHPDPPLDPIKYRRDTLPPLTEDSPRGNVTFKPAASLQQTTTTTTTVTTLTAHRSMFGTSKERELGVAEKSAPPSSLDQINGGDAGLDDLDFFDKKLPSHIDDGHLR